MPSSHIFMGTMVLAVLALTLEGYQVPGIDVNFDCGDIGDTMSRICKTFPSRVSRSISDTEAPPTDYQGFHPRALNLTRGQGTMENLLLSPEAAHSFIKTPKSRVKRSYNVHDECCNHVSQHRCNAEEILEYCEDRVP